MKQSMKGAEQNMSSAFHRQWLEDIVFYFPHLWVEKYNIDYNRMQYNCQLEYLIYSVAKLWSWEYSILFYFVHHSFIIPSVHHSYFFQFICIAHILCARPSHLTFPSSCFFLADLHYVPYPTPVPTPSCCLWKWTFTNHHRSSLLLAVSDNWAVLPQHCSADMGSAMSTPK